MITVIVIMITVIMINVITVIMITVIMVTTILIAARSKDRVDFQRCSKTRLSCRQIFVLFHHLDLLMIKFLQAIHCRHLNNILAIIIALTNTAIFITLPLNLTKFRRYKKALQTRPP